MSHDVFSGEAKQRSSYKDSLASALAGACLCLIFTASPVTTAAAQARTIADCEKIQAADAYNQCLASFGPVAHEHGVTPDPEGSSGKGGMTPKGASANAAAEHHPSSGRSRKHGHAFVQRSSRHHAGHAADPWAHMRHSSGRHRAEFRVK